MLWGLIGSDPPPQTTSQKVGSFIGDHPVLVWGGLALAVILAAWLWMRKRRKE